MRSITPLAIFHIQNCEQVNGSDTYFQVAAAAAVVMMMVRTRMCEHACASNKITMFAGNTQYEGIESGKL